MKKYRNIIGLVVIIVVLVVGIAFWRVTESKKPPTKVDEIVIETFVQTSISEVGENFTVRTMVDIETGIEYLIVSEKNNGRVQVTPRLNKEGLPYLNHTAQ